MRWQANISELFDRKNHFFAVHWLLARKDVGLVLDLLGDVSLVDSGLPSPRS